MKVLGLSLRGVLDSRARVTFECDALVAHEGRVSEGTGSAPRAIAPGRREQARGAPPALGPWRDRTVEEVLLGQDVDGFRGFDGLLDGLLASGLGADTALACSLAVSRAEAAAGRLQPFELWRDEARPTPGLPRLLVNVLSGGIHRQGAAATYQQVMVIPDTGSLHGDVDCALRVYTAAERRIDRHSSCRRYSASSGLIVDLPTGAQLGLVADAVDDAGARDECSLGVDVAAEHLLTGDGRYRLDDELLTAPELAAVVRAQAATHRLTFIEDPFDASDEAAWRGLREALDGAARVIGDDLFATDAARVDPGLAHGILLKLSQAGTVSRTLDAAAAARAAGLDLAVSHRSGETEDTGMCDLAVAVGAGHIKVGGPRRGDRLTKYNRLLRLAEHLNPDAPRLILSTGS